MEWRACFCGWNFLLLLLGGTAFLGFGVKEVVAYCPSQVVSDTRECEHVWERLDLPNCIGVEALYEFTEYDFGLCNYEVRLENHCLVAYEFVFECDSGMFCPESYVLEPNESGNVRLRTDNYGNDGVSAKTMVMLFASAEEVGEEVGEDDGVFDEARTTAGMFRGSSLGEVSYGIPPGCRDVVSDSGCQVVSEGRPGGGDFVGVMVMFLGMLAWRRRMV